MEELVGMITNHLKKGERVKIAGLGVLQVRNRAARMGRHPRTGEAIQIKASKRSPSASPRNSRRRFDRQAMPCDGAIIFSDLIGKLDVLTLATLAWVDL